ncbi:MAG: hypothetical protein NT157_06295, partial [Candidatus Micrarchaeota archaeon]|nr:hypothetical protein [Candidatus Micrarchaeota archaeon]
KNLTDNWLFIAYYFCEQLRVNNTALIMARVKLTGLRDRMAPLLTLSNEVESIRESTSSRKNYAAIMFGAGQPDSPKRETIWDRLSEPQKRHLAFVISSMLGVFGFIVS